MSELTREQKELQEAREALRKPFEEAPAPAEDPVGTPQAVSAPPPPVDPVPDIPKGTPQDAPGTESPEPPAAPSVQADDGQDTAKLRQEHEALVKQFKAIQAAITPTQQQNAELRKKLQAKDEELQRLQSEKTPERDSRKEASPLDAPDFKGKLGTVREVMPEVADLLEATVQENVRLKAEFDQRFTQHDTQRHEELVKATMTELFRRRPEAQQIAQDPNFWAWIDAQGPESTSYRNILREPWMGENFQGTLAILDAYQAIRPVPMGAPLPGASTPVTSVPSPVTAPPPTAPRPTDLGVPTRAMSRATTQGRPGLMADSQIRELEVSLRKGSAQDARSIVEKLREDMRLRAQR